MRGFAYLNLLLTKSCQTVTEESRNMSRVIYMLCRQMYTVSCYLTQFLLNAAKHVSSLYKAHLQGLFC
jgi:hypothetical protein